MSTPKLALSLLLETQMVPGAHYVSNDSSLGQTSACSGASGPLQT